MSNTVNPISKTSFHNLLPSKAGKEITQEDEESFNPPAGKGWCELVQVNDFFANPNKKQKEIFNKNWIKKLVLNKSRKKFDECYTALIEEGFSDEKAKANLAYSASNFARAKNTATIQESWGKKGSTATNVTIVVGVLKKLFGESLPKPVQIILDLIYGASKSTRSSYQGSLYNLNDDDASKNRYEAEVYDNKVAGFFGTVGAFVETKINSWALTIIELFPENIKDSFKKILTSFNPLWFRARMPAHIRQSFFTDFFRWVFHIIPSLFGLNKSTEVINKVKERGNLKASYIWERTCKLSGLKEKKDHTLFKYISQIGRLIKGCFSKDLSKIKQSTEKLNETLATPLGIYGFFAMSIGGVCGSVLKFLNLENKFFDFLYSTSITSQQFIYLPRLVAPFYIKSKETEVNLKNIDFLNGYKQKEIDNLKKLCKEQKNLYYTGILCFGLSILNSSLKLKKTENPILQKIKDVVDELTVDLIQKFFSHRRHIIGKQFMLENPEFYANENKEINEISEAQKDVNVERV